MSNFNIHDEGVLLLLVKLAPENEQSFGVVVMTASISTYNMLYSSPYLDVNFGSIQRFPLLFPKFTIR